MRTPPSCYEDILGFLPQCKIFRRPHHVLWGRLTLKHPLKKTILDVLLPHSMQKIEDLKAELAQQVWVGAKRASCGGVEFLGKGNQTIK